MIWEDYDEMQEDIYDGLVDDIVAQMTDLELLEEALDPEVRRSFLEAARKSRADRFAELKASRAAKWRANRARHEAEASSKPLEAQDNQQPVVKKEGVSD